MKLRAYILLLTFMAFTVQTVVLPNNCAAMQHQQKAPACSNCPMMAMQQACMHHSAATQNNSSDGKQQPAKCADCPLCTILQYTPAQHFTVANTPVNIEYNIARTGNLQHYNTPQWKPPNRLAA